MVKLSKNEVTFQNLKVRNYARDLRRKPLAVLSIDHEEKTRNSKSNVKTSNIVIDRHRATNSARSRSRTGPGTGPKQFYTNPEIRFENDIEPKSGSSPSAYVKFEKLTEGDKRFGPVMMAAKSRNQREKRKVILLEGRRLIVDAVNAGRILEKLYFNRREVLDELCTEIEITNGTEVYKILPHHMRLWSDVQTPPGIIGIFKRPNQGEVFISRDDVLPITVICDNIRDPGNMGTLLRSAAAAGCHRVLVAKGCVDVWDLKVLRAGSGAQFRLPIINNLGWEVLHNYLPGDTDVYLANNQPAITKGHINKKVVEKLISDEDGEKNELGGVANPETGVKEFVNETYLDEKKMKLYAKLPLITNSYDSVDYLVHGNHIAVVIGGETEGLSAAAKKLAYDRFGQAISIPMTASVDSLNAALAGSIILFEIKRQLQKPMLPTLKI